MPRRQIVWIITFICLIVVVFVFATPCSQIFTTLSFKLLHLDTGGQPTNNQAQSLLERAQDIINSMNVVVSLMGIFLAVVAVVGGVLGFLGFNSINEVNGYKDRLQKELNASHEEIEQKKREIDDLQRDVKQRQQEIESLQKSVQEVERELNKRAKEITNDIDNTKNALTYLILGSQLLDDPHNIDKALEAEHVEQAILAYKKAQQLRPKDPQINYALGRVYRRQGKYREAIACFQTALQVDIDFPEAEMEMGLAYRYLSMDLSGNEQREARQHAIEHLQRAVQLRSNYWEALGTIGGLYRREGNYTEALHYYKLADKADTTDTTSYGAGNIASLAWYLEDYDEAETYFEQTEKLAKQRITTNRSSEPYWDYYDLALAQLMLTPAKLDEEGTIKALETYETAIQKTPANPYVFEGVLDNLYLIQKGARNRGKEIPGLSEAITKVEQAKDQSAENKIQ